MTGDEDGAGDGSIAVTLRPAAGSAPPGVETTVAVVVEAAADGIAAFESVVHLDGPGRVHSLELAGNPAVPVTDIRNSGTSAVMAAAMGPAAGHEADAEIVVAELTLVGEGPGEITLSVDTDTQVGPVGGGTERYTVEEYGRATIQVTEPTDDE